VTLEVSSAYPAGNTVSVDIIEAPDAEICLRLRVPSWTSGTAVASETPTERSRSHLEIRRVFRAGESVAVTFPGGARAVYPDPRIDATRGTFAVERGPLVLALESPDLPEHWDVNEITADPDSIITDEAGTTIKVRRRVPAPAPWPYSPEPAVYEGEHARARLIPYHDWANRGPATMRTWLPLVSRTPATGSAGNDGKPGIASLTSGPPQ
jgi:hypothetical protein